MTPKSQPTLPGHRADIQGLRAVAALLVAAYHIWFGRVSGGVDVFIVVSAFLITKSLVRDAEAGHPVRFGAYWARLARRLLPAAVTVLVATALASILLMPRARWIATIGDVTASALYLENWLLAFRSVDYLAQATTSSPLQHFWALSVQGQLYMLWPVLIAGAALAAARFRLALRPVALLLVGGAFVVSLGYSVVRTAANQPFTYFDTVARVWEFGLGALFALAMPWLRVGSGSRVALGWIGLILILSCGIVLQVSRVFPGYAALWPTMGAMLILVSWNPESRWGVDRLLGFRPLTWLGDRSYSVYLWHWPILVFYRVYRERFAVGLAEGLAIILVSVALAEVTTRFIEEPIRRPTNVRDRRRTATIGLAGLGAFATGLVAWAGYALVMRQVDGRVLSPGDPAYPGAAVMLAGAPAALAPVPVHPGPLAVKTDRPSVFQKDCFQTFHASAPLSCDFGADDPTVVIAAVGGSYVAHWMPALRMVAQQEGWRIVTYTKNRCWFSTEERVVFGEEYESCELWNENVLDELRRERPDVVFTRASRGSGAAEVVPAGFVEQWRRLDSAGIRVVALRKTPRFPFDVPDCVERRGAGACAQPRESVHALESPLARAPDVPPNVRFIDMSRFFCDSHRCPAVIGNILVYSDDSHMTTHYARTLAPMLRDEMRAALAAPK